MTGPDGAEFAGDLARRAFDSVADIQAAQDLEALNRIAGEAFAGFGFDMFIGFDAVDPAGRQEVKPLFGKVDAAWVDHYKSHNFDRNDAMIRASLRRTDPFFWSDITVSTVLSEAERQVMDHASEFGLKEGFLAPLRAWDGSISAVMLSGSQVDLRHPDLRPAVHVMSTYFSAVGRRLVRKAGAASSVRRITPHQLECLKWVREGKSARDIGDIIGVSQRTVEYHLAAACRTLGVRTRVQAVAEAMAHKLID
jgi:DNA-binding CsgD family transcriptional regulator